jgi:sporulation protein YlmC with PRC-barrel domain
LWTLHQHSIPLGFPSIYRVISGKQVMDNFIMKVGKIKDVDYIVLKGFIVSFFFWG